MTNRTDVGPFGMVDETWRQGVEVEIAHTVAADDHRRMLLVEFVHDGLQRIGRGIEVVAVELHGEAAAMAVVHSDVPASADAEVVPVGNDMYEPWLAVALFLLLGVAGEQFCGLVGGVVVHHDYVELELGLL